MRIELDIDDALIAAAVFAGLASGIAYWGKVVEMKTATTMAKPLSGYNPPDLSAAFTEGCYTRLQNTEGDTVPRDLHLRSIREGLIVMSRHAPKHFGDLLGGDSDATTGDIFIQCCVFGRILYG